MAWFHKTLGDMLEEIEKGNWQAAKDISDQHLECSKSNDIDEGLSMAVTFLRTYNEKMTNVHRILTQPRSGDLRIPKGVEISILKVSAKEARASIARFEKIMKRLENEGKLQE